MIQRILTNQLINLGIRLITIFSFLPIKIKLVSLHTTNKLIL